MQYILQLNKNTIIYLQDIKYNSIFARSNKYNNTITITSNAPVLQSIKHIITITTNSGVL